MLDKEQFDAICTANSFAVYNDIKIRQTGEDEGDAFLEIGPNNRNLYGYLHGGAYYTLADCACGCACRSDGRRYVTLHGSIDFVRSAKEGVITARARVIHRGCTTALVSVEIRGQDDTLYATGRFTFFCTGTL